MANSSGVNPDEEFTYDGPDSGEGVDFATPSNNFGFTDSTDVTGTMPPDDSGGGWPGNMPPGYDGGGQTSPFGEPSTDTTGGRAPFNLGDFLKGAGKDVAAKLAKLTPKQMAALGLLAQQLLGGHGQQTMADLLAQNPSLDSLMKLQASQAQRQDPLHHAVTQLATNLLPNSAFGAGPNRPVIG